MSIFHRAGLATLLASAAAATVSLAQQPTAPVPPPAAAEAPPAAPTEASPLTAAPSPPPAAAPAPPLAAAPPVGMEDCAACHGLTKDAPPSIGPNLWGVGGRLAGATDYPYSPTMKAYGVTWTPETLTPFIQRPTATVPGTTMAYPGQPDPTAAKAIADYLMTLKD